MATLYSRVQDLDARKCPNPPYASGKSGACGLMATTLSPRRYFGSVLVSQSSCDVWSLGHLEGNGALC